MPTQRFDKVIVDSLEMENSISSNSPISRSSSDNSVDSGKGPPNNDDTIGSSTSFACRAYPSDASTIHNSTSVLIQPMRRVSKSDSPRYTSFKSIRDSSSINSVYNVQTVAEMTEEEKRKITWKNLTVLYCCIYGILLTITGAIVYVNHQTSETRRISEIFSTCIAVIGLSWMIFLHIDLYRYKRQIIKNVIIGTKEMDKISTITDFNLAGTFIGNETPPYRFLRGRHSGSFYLKLGLAAFCFGHLVNEGLLLGQELINFFQKDRYELGCGNPASIIHHTIRPLYSFYQLFIVFKYSNIIINRHKVLACFSLMHIIATCLCFWFGTIVDEALEDYHHHMSKKINITDNLVENITNQMTSDTAICSQMGNDSTCLCLSTAILSVNNVQAIPYLYPFTIEFNILLAGVWFIVWHNIGKKDHKANPHHFQHKVHSHNGVEEVTYQSNLVISADCHASNKGLFAGIFLLMASIISIIVFFVSMSIEKYQHLAVSVYFIQEGTLSILALLGVLIGYRQLSKLDFSIHPIHFLDDVLLFVPLPFFFIQALLTIISEFQKQSVVRLFISVLVPIQVILQTPFIIDGLRRCSNSQALGYKKPGREIITFLIICNLTIWIINTFEAKSVESHYGQHAYFGRFVWMFVSHTNLPLMLFYRFHSSACLADIWKSAYNKEE